MAKSPKGRKNLCSRGHTFYKSSDCPVCPKCWPARHRHAQAVAGGSGFYRQRKQSDFPEKLGAPALRALLNAKIISLKQLVKYTESEVLALHGMGPSGIRLLKQALRNKKLSFRH